MLRPFETTKSISDLSVVVQQSLNEMRKFQRKYQSGLPASPMYRACQRIHMYRSKSARVNFMQPLISYISGYVAALLHY
jgi:hypothetical protein